MAKEDLSIELANHLAPEISAAVWVLEDCRARTIKALSQLPEAALDWEAPNYPNSIGTLLYHIAAIEADWFYVEVMGGGIEAVESWFPYEVRDETGRLTPVRGFGIRDYLARLKAIRANLLSHFQTMRLEQFHQSREMEHYHVTPQWVLHHLAQHEAEHRGEILMLRGLFQAENGL
jgi:uncharacterized damage-inducible protein DinB